jgi:hypothetical protein
MKVLQGFAESFRISQWQTRKICTRRALSAQRFSAARKGEFEPFPMAFTIKFDSESESDEVPTIPLITSPVAQESSSSAESSAPPVDPQPQALPIPTSATFHCHRSSGGVTHRRSFSFSNSESPVYSAKFRSADKIAIGGGSEIHLSERNFSHTIKISDAKKRKFVLFESGQQRGVLEFSHVSPTRPRNLLLQWSEPPLTLTNLQPTFNAKVMRWQLDFDGRYLVRSTKNAVLVDDNSTPIVVVRKIMANDLELEMRIPIDPLLLFFLGIGAFTCRL